MHNTTLDQRNNFWALKIFIPVMVEIGKLNHLLRQNHSIKRCKNISQKINQILNCQDSLHQKNIIKVTVTQIEFKFLVQECLYQNQLQVLFLKIVQVEKAKKFIRNLRLMNLSTNKTQNYFEHKDKNLVENLLN